MSAVREAAGWCLQDCLTDGPITVHAKLQMLLAGTNRVLAPSPQEAREVQQRMQQLRVGVVPDIVSADL